MQQIYQFTAREPHGFLGGALIGRDAARARLSPKAIEHMLRTKSRSFRRGFLASYRMALRQGR